MQINVIPEKLRRLEIPGRVDIVAGHGGLPLVKVRTPWSTAEVYLHAAHVTHFQKNGEPPLLFLSAKTHYAEGKAIRGGVPICYPWFGGREGDLSHGFARFTAWELIKATASESGVVTLHFALPALKGRENWKSLRTEFIVTVAASLTMELIATNDSCGETFTVENCLHTYFQVSDISAVAISGLQNTPYNDFAAGAAGAAKIQSEAVLRIPSETNRAYSETTATVEIRDEKWHRLIRVEKFNSHSTVVWNPWTTQKLPDDFDPAEYTQMVCVESGNVKQHKLSLTPGQSSALKVVLHSAPLQ